MTDPNPPSPHLVIVDFQDISDPSKDLTNELERAIGGRLSLSTTDESNAATPLGIIAIRNVPGFVEAKNKFLPMAHTLAHLKPEYLQSLEDPTSLYNAGWSHGREKLSAEPDFAKASYYFNPLVDVPGTQEERDKYPASYPSNKWPNENDLPQLKEFKQSAQTLGKILHQTVVHLAKHIDAMAAKKVVGYRKDLLFDAMKHTEKAKGRLLYYYPIDQTKKSQEDNWIGWHNDSGFLTSHAGDLFLDDETSFPLSPDQIDPEAGLYVTDRAGKSIHVKIPEDCMFVQIGECVQILTGGVVVATPHCVRGPRAGFGTHCDTAVKVARISCPCFIDSKPSFPLTLPEGCTRENVCHSGVGREKVPLLEERWLENGMSFGSFLQKSFEKYYDWSS